MASRGTPIPWPLREEIRRLRDDGKSYCAIAKELDLSDRTVRKYLRVYRVPSSTIAETT